MFRLMKYTSLWVLFCIVGLYLGAGASSAVAADKKEAFVKIATGNTGGTYYPVGVGISQLLSRKNNYIVSSAMSTGGSVDNIGLLRNDEAQVAILMATVANWAYFGEDRFQQKPYKELRTITSLWPNLNHIVVLNDIKTFDDLKGRRFVVGAPRSGTETDSHAILSAMGLYYHDEDGGKVNLEPIWVNYGEAVEGMKNRTVSGALFNTYPPGSAVAELLASGDAHILSLSDEQVKSISDSNPLYSSYTIPAGTYPHQEADVQVCGYPNLLTTSSESPPDLIYDITKTIFENPEYLESIHKATKFIRLETATKGVKVPFHEGAVRYLKEQGVWKE